MNYTTYEDDFMKVDIFIGLSSEKRINAQFRNALTNYTESDIWTKIKCKKRFVRVERFI